MDKKKLKWQLAVIGLVVLLFLGIDLAIYQLFIKRVISHHSPGMQKMSVEVSDYVPFTGSENLYSIQGAVELEGDLPTIDGAAALMPMYAGFVESIYPADSVIYNGESYDDASAMHYTNTRGAYKDIVDGNADLIICVAPSQEQLAYAAQNGVDLEMVEIGKDAFVFIVNSDNPVSDLTVEQIRGIYSGEITNWKELGGPNVPIAAMRRNEGSGSQTALENLMGDTPIVADYTALFGSPIGFSFRYYVTGMLAEGGVKMLSVNGVEPNIENIASGAYPVTSSIYAVYRKGETNENVYKAVDFMLSKEGQEIVEKSGYVPVK
ncbi:MAG: substrate-binding domain-containing protein [Clostridiales bacterium]|nr:substrate-binding domain-containing protein [Clostridiales bacterium]MBR6986562.1 substrate-binding domain-containing protein [Clostridiales bacterium]